ncbi:transcriptional regulator, IclR family [Poseidonocella pacifica]|uniref:Transcriptional regulator, IclR family n=1 Tax=Poseidonocella pacifica TaxID=871651 RepID=A0A1I0XXQ4_9RHOB|nr:IclR family transcriptional regulator [Poseidonocella pacifica]SFB05206.1 transcriptional regulator, IclR family [Poseidonocella pacifica]
MSTTLDDRKGERRGRGRPRGPAAATGSIQALDRALSVLQSLAAQGRVKLTDLALEVGIPTATAYRILTTLHSRGFVDFEEATQSWKVGLEAYRTGSAYLVQTQLVDAARPAMRDLMEESGETANLAIPDGGEVVFIGQVETRNPIRAFFQPGTRTKMHASGTGKAILAAMSEAQVVQILTRQGLPQFTETTLVTKDALFADLHLTRERGWSFDRDERHVGMSCIGAPIFNNRGDVRAGISISGPSARFDDGNIPLLGRRVRTAADWITQITGGTPPEIPAP